MSTNQQSTAHAFTKTRPRTVHRYDIGGGVMPGWDYEVVHAVCQCGYETLGFATDEHARKALEAHHIFRKRQQALIDAGVGQ